MPYSLKGGAPPLSVPASVAHTEIPDGNGLLVNNRYIT